jgi:protein scribble
VEKITCAGNGLNVEYEEGIMARHMFLVFQVVPGGIAARSGKLRMGDRILKVNGEDVTKSSHQEAVLKLLRPGDEVVLTIQHDPLPDGYQVGTLLA